jgi:hypothetical protein
LARHPRLSRFEALKILRADVSADPDYQQRFNREADLAAGLWHPHIVTVHDRGEFEGQLWITMDYVDGSDIAALMGQEYPGGMPAGQVVAIMAAVGAALDRAHHRGPSVVRSRSTTLDAEAAELVTLAKWWTPAWAATEQFTPSAPEVKASSPARPRISAKFLMKTPRSQGTGIGSSRAIASISTFDTAIWTWPSYGGNWGQPFKLAKVINHHCHAVERLGSQPGCTRCQIAHAAVT